MATGKILFIATIALIAGFVSLPGRASAQGYTCASATAYEHRLIAQIDGARCDDAVGAEKAWCRGAFRELVRAERERDRACALGALPRNRGGFLNNLLSPGAGFVMGGF